MRRLAKASILSGLVCGLVVGCPVRAQVPSADEIMVRMQEHNAQRQAMLQHYASDRTYKLVYSGTAGDHHAEMVVHAEYTAPGVKRLTVLSESGSKVLCREVLRKLVEGEQETAAKADWQRAMFSLESYDAEVVGQETLDGVATWVLRVEPKHGGLASKNGAVAYRARIWVSMQDYATVRMVGEPAKSPSWMLSKASFDTWYMRRGEVWVPEKNLSTTHVRIGGEAKVTIDYGQYPVLATMPLNAAEPERNEVFGKRMPGVVR